MIDPRIYRLAFAPALIALIVLMFSVESIPAPVQAPETFAADFDGRRAAANARRIVQLAPERTPGSTDDEAVADLLAERFGEISAGKVSEQEFEADFDGEAVDLRNVVLTLPGNSARTVIVIAERDTARGSGAASSAAANGLLLEMAAKLGQTRHEKTIVLVSADGGSEGASGVREFIDSYPTLDQVDGVVVVSRPGAAKPKPPHLPAWSVGAQSTSAQLVESASLALSEETELQPGLGGFLGGVFRLAIPAGAGAEAVAISENLDAIAISGAGEGALEPDDDNVASLSDDSMGEFGNAALALVLALDAADAELVHGPDTYLELAGNLIPGWALGLLALTLLLPGVVVSIDGIARASRRREPALGSLLWAVSRAVPFVAALLLLYALALVGIAPDPSFPFDPGYYGFGWRGAGVFAATLGVFALLAVLLRPLTVPPRPARETLATALGVVASLAVLGIWLINPYLALLCVPLAHVWILGARPATAASIAGTLAGIAVALIPLAGALVHLAGRLDLGVEAPWTVVLMVTGGQIGFLEAFLGCLIAGSVLGLLALAVPRRSDRRARGSAVMPSPITDRGSRANGFGDSVR
ncbi:MAG: hypothetical protein ACR2OC_00645 [Solirubrobacterales bacterium]